MHPASRWLTEATAVPTPAWSASSPATQTRTRPCARRKLSKDTQGNQCKGGNRKDDDKADHDAKKDDGKRDHDAKKDDGKKDDGKKDDGKGDHDAKKDDGKKDDGKRDHDGKDGKRDHDGKDGKKDRVVKKDDHRKDHVVKVINVEHRKEVVTPEVKTVVAPTGGIDAGDGGSSGGADGDMIVGGAGMLAAAALGCVALRRRRPASGTLA